MAADKNISKSALDRRKQALRDNLKRRKGALRGITSRDGSKGDARPKPRSDALKPRRNEALLDKGLENGPESESGS